MPDTEAAYETKEFSLLRSIITSVTREGPDVVVAIRNLKRRHRFPASARFTSVCGLAPDAEFRLEPGWLVEKLNFDGIVARLSVSYEEMPAHMIITVFHQIYCDDLIFERRLDIRQTLRATFFANSTAMRSGVNQEPPPSPPIEGQEQLGDAGRSGIKLAKRLFPRTRPSSVTETRDGGDPGIFGRR